MQQFILAMDQGTTGSTALVIDSDLKIRGAATVDFPQHFPEPSWVEHDLEEIWSSMVSAVKQSLAKAGIDGKSIAAIGITNQRETTCLWERNDAATPVHRAIVWQDRRTAADCMKLKARGLEKLIHRRTGLLLDPYFSGTKLAWLLKNVPGAQAKAKAGKLAFGTIDTFLAYKLSGEHVTEPSNACRTLLMNLQTCQWDDEMLKLFKIPKQILPVIKNSSDDFGKTRNVPGLPDGIPITGIAGDQQSALFGQACFKPGTAKCTYGTGAFILANTGSKPVFSKHRLLTSIAWSLDGKPTYCIEGSAFIAGAAVQWIRDGLKLIPKSSEVEALAATVSDSDGVIFVPALSGMGAPHWLAGATGLITGLTRRSTKAHVARATLDGIAFQVRELLEAMKKDLGKTIRPIKVDGGASANDLLMQFQADLMGVEVVRSKIMETTALGAGLLAGLRVGVWSGLPEIEKKWEASGRFTPKMDAKKKKAALARWDRAILALKLLAN